LAITNALLRSSPSVRISPYIHGDPKKRGIETYTASLGVSIVRSAGDTERLAQPRAVPEVVGQTLSGLMSVIHRVERYRYMAHCAVIGRGFNYSTAFEVSLKIKELTRVVTEPYSSADFRHGPIAMVRDGFPVVLIAPRGAAFHDMKSLVDEVRVWALKC
jgi:glucosamine--fructose-6-phosphate aminotransferase (isomerizing)